MSKPAVRTDRISPDDRDSDRKSKFIVSSRYLSRLEDNDVRVDISHPKSPSKNVATIALGEIHLAVRSDFKTSVVHPGLTEFPHILLAWKICIDRRILARRIPDASVASTAITHIRIFTTWMMRKGLFRYSDLTRDDTDEYIEELRAAGSFYELLGYEAAYRRIADLAMEDLAFAQSFVGTALGVKRQILPINLARLEAATGLPIHMRSLYQLKETLIPILENPKWIAGRRYELLGLSTSVLEQHFASLCVLSHFVPEADGLIISPFTSYKVLARKVSTRQTDARTINMDVEYASKVIGASLSFVYDFAPGIFDLIERVKERAKREATGTRVTYGARNASVTGDLPEIIRQVREKFLLPDITIDTLLSSIKENSFSVSDLVDALLTACFILITLNNGRRRSEVQGGRDIPYGLHQGCVSPVDAGLGLHRLNIFIEKTYMDWLDVYCNVLVRDAVNSLERLFKLLGTTDNADDSQRSGRQAHLFKLFRITAYIPRDQEIDPANFFAPKNYDFGSADSDSFFSLINVENQLAKRAHAFRRLFSILYYYRFDHATLLALKQHLRHLDPQMTKVYITDPHMREQADSINESLNKLARFEDRDFLSAHREAESEYFSSVIESILSGNPVGGLFPRLVMKLAARLMRDTSFRRSPTKDKAKTLADRYAKRGYRPEPKSNGVCMAGTAKRTKSSSNCFDISTSEIKPEDASIKTCHRCIHSYTNENYLSVQGDELAALIVESESFDVPEPVRNRKQQQVIQLKGLLSRERELQASTKDYIEKTLAALESAAARFCV